MDVSLLLQFCRRHVQDAARIKEQIKELEYSMARCGGGAGAQIAKESLGDRFAAYAARKDELEGRLRDVQRKLAAEQTAVILLTDELAAPQRKAVRGFYVYAEGAARIAEKEGYTVSNVYKLMHGARDALSAIPEERVEETLPGWYVKDILAAERQEEGKNG